MFLKITPGNNIPDDFHVIIEIPAHSEPVKYEVDKESGVMFVDRFMTSTMRYPCDYGYIPNTCAEDGDPVDVLVVSPFPLLSGCVIQVRPIGMLKMTDESGKDAKILAVPIDSLTTLYQNVNKPEDLFPVLIDQITHFFRHYKDLEPDRWVKIEGWEGSDAAKAEINAGFKRYHSSQCFIVFCSCPDETLGQKLAELALDSKLAACINLIPNMTSMYTWEGKKEKQAETLLMIKTTKTAYPELELLLSNAHPYSCPEIIGFPIELGKKGYLQWLNETVLKSPSQHS